MIIDIKEKGASQSKFLTDITNKIGINAIAINEWYSRQLSFAINTYRYKIKINILLALIGKKEINIRYANKICYINMMLQWCLPQIYFVG